MADEGEEIINTEGEPGENASTAGKDEGEDDGGVEAKATAADTESKVADADEGKEASPEDELNVPGDDARSKSSAGSKASVKEGDENKSIASKDVATEDQESPSASKEIEGEDQESPTSNGPEGEESKTGQVEDNASTEGESRVTPPEREPEDKEEERKKKAKDVQKGRSTGQSVPEQEEEQMTTEQQAKVTRSIGAKEYVRRRRSSTLGDDESALDGRDVDPHQRISLLSEHAMEELSQKPRVHAPPPTRKSSLFTSSRMHAAKDQGGKFIDTSDLKMGGTRMSTLTDYLKKKHKDARKKSLAKEMDETMNRAFPDGRPSLYEQYTKYTEERINELSKHFTAEKMMEYRDAFYNFDDDIDGFIPIGEVPFLMRALCENPTEEELYEWISEVDVDSLGSIDFADFLTIMSKKVQTNPIGYEEVLQAFQTFDNHRNGVLCAKELAYLMTTFGETLSEEELADMLNEVNMNEDFEIPYIEFAKKITDC